MLEISCALVVIAALAWDAFRRHLAQRNNAFQQLEQRISQMEEERTRILKDWNVKFEKLEARITQQDQAIKQLGNTRPNTHSNYPIRG